MVYTRRTVWPLVFGIIMVAYAYMVQSGAMEPRHQVPRHRQATRARCMMLGYAFGGIAIVVGLWQLLATPKRRPGRLLPLHHRRRHRSSCWSRSS